MDALEIILSFWFFTKPITVVCETPSIEKKIMRNIALSAQIDFKLECFSIIVEIVL